LVALLATAQAGTSAEGFSKGLTQNE